MSRGTRFRIPRKSAKAQSKLYRVGLKGLTTGERRRLHRMLCLSPFKWTTVRRVAAHVAMGDTTGCRRREVRERAYAAADSRWTRGSVLPIVDGEFREVTR